MWTGPQLPCANVDLIEGPLPSLLGMGGLVES